MDGSEFQRALQELFGQMGYDVERIRGFDKGADLILTLDSTRTAVQAKRSATSVGITAVRQLLDGRARYDCTEARLVTNHFFTERAFECAEFHQIELWDRRELSKYVAGDPPTVDLTVCADCGVSVSAGVTKWCLDHPSRYDGNVFCPKHQPRAQRRVA